MKLAVLCGVAALSAGAAAAEDGAEVEIDEMAERISILSAYLECRSIGLDEPGTDEGRLVCYDGMLDDVLADAQDLAQGGADGCSIEDYTYGERADSTYITGSTTCPSGRMDYRIHDETGAFRYSGFTYFSGYAFQAYADVFPVPPEIEIRYSIAPQ